MADDAKRMTRDKQIEMIETADARLRKRVADLLKLPEIKAAIHRKDDTPKTQEESSRRENIN